MVHFSEPVRNVDESDFQVKFSRETRKDLDRPFYGSIAHSLNIVDVSSSEEGTSYLVQVYGYYDSMRKVGIGTLWFNLSEGLDIEDYSGNKLVDIIPRVPSDDHLLLFTQGPIMTISAEGRIGERVVRSNDAVLHLQFESTQRTTDFDVGDININSGGAISNFRDDDTKPGYMFLADYTPTRDGRVTISVGHESFTGIETLYDTLYDIDVTTDIMNKSVYAPDSKLDWYQDLTPPTMNMFSAYYGKSDSMIITFLPSEAITNFDVGDISVSNGVITSFGPTSGLYYFAYLTPDATGKVTIDVAAGSFTDLAGNGNVAATHWFDWVHTLDLTGPTIEIDAPWGYDGFKSNDTEITLIFTSSEPTTNYTVDDIEVSNGVITPLQYAGVNKFSTVLTPLAFGEVTVDVPAGSFTDAAGNGNVAATQFNWFYGPDFDGPTIRMFSPQGTDGFSSSDIALKLDFRINNVTTDFTVDDISVNNAVIDSFTVINSTFYHAVLIPRAAGEVTIDVPARVFTNPEGTGNIAATQFNWFYVPPDAPFMNIHTDKAKGFTSSAKTIELTFTSTEPTTNFTVDDISVSNGEIDIFWSFTRSVYMATLTPVAAGEVIIDVDAESFTDVAGNGNLAITQFNWFYDFTGPTMTITADEGLSGFSSADTEITLTFTSSEATTNFDVGDISVSNGVISDFASSSSAVYTATFTPEPTDGKATIDVVAGVFTDAAGNDNVADSQFNWFYTDGNLPAIISTSLECGNQFDILFSKEVTTASAQHISNYRLDNNATVSSAVLATDNRTVTIFFSTHLTPFTSYTLTVNNIMDRAIPSNIIEINTEESLTHEGLIVNGGIGAVYYAQRPRLGVEPTSGAFFTGAPVVTTDTTINNDWGQGKPNNGSGAVSSDHFSVRWTGVVEAVYSEDYTFSTESDDGVRLYIDGIMVINNWTNHGPTVDTSVPITLEAGRQYALMMVQIPLQSAPPRTSAGVR